jgi:hypothetical protein
VVGGSREQDESHNENNELSSQEWEALAENTLSLFH